MKRLNLFKTFLSISGRYCLCCNKAIYPNYRDSLCSSCKNKITWISSNPMQKSMDDFVFDDVLSCCIYGFEAKNIISSFKAGKTYYKEPIANLMADRYLNSAIIADTICFVPSDKEKAIHIRGFVPTKLLAKIIAKKVNLPLIDGLEKPQRTLSNRRSSALERSQNVYGAYRVKLGYESCFCGKNILLVDDVITTGSTANEVSKELKKAGANKVYILCFASGSGSSI